MQRETRECEVSDHGGGGMIRLANVADLRVKYRMTGPTPDTGLPGLPAESDGDNDSFSA